MNNLKGIQCIMDDVECVKLITEAGLLDQLRPRPGFNQVSATFKHGDALCMAMRHCGTGDDGYMVIIIPHHVMGTERACEFFADFISEASTGEIEMSWEDKTDIRHN